MGLMRTSVLSGLSTGIRLLCGLVINKLVAVIGGPAGFALVSQLQNAFALASTLSSGAMGNGVTILTARYEDDPAEQRKFFATAFFTIAATSLPITLLGIILAPQLATALLHDAKYFYVIVAAALTIPLFAFGSMLTFIVTGKQDIVSLVGINILSSILTLIFTVLLTWFYYLPGALLATATYQGTLLLVAICWLWRAPWLNLASFMRNATLPYAKDLLRFTLMAGISGVSINLAQFAVRNHIISVSGLNDAGIWDTVNRISMLNWTVMSAILSVYLFPKLAPIRDEKKLITEIIQTVKYVIPIFTGICIVISLLADYLIIILFTKEFSGASDLLPIQLIGDIARVFSWFYAYTLITRQHILHYAAIEICSNVIFVFVAIFAAGIWGNLSPVIANAVAFGLLAIYCGARIRAVARQQ